MLLHWLLSWMRLWCCSTGCCPGWGSGDWTGWGSNFSRVMCPWSSTSTETNTGPMCNVASFFLLDWSSLQITQLGCRREGGRNNVVQVKCLKSEKHEIGRECRETPRQQQAESRLFPSGHWEGEKCSLEMPLESLNWIPFHKVKNTC